MKTEFEIYMNFKKAEAQAENMRKFAQVLLDVAGNDVGQIIRQLRNNWTGDNSDKLMTKADVLRERMVNSAKELQELADVVIRIAEKTQKYELAAIGIARG